MHKLQSDKTVTKRRRRIRGPLSPELPCSFLQGCFSYPPVGAPASASGMRSDIPLITGTLGRFIGLFRSPWVEFGLYGLILLCLVFLARNFRRPPKAPWQRLLPGLGSGAGLHAELRHQLTTGCPSPPTAAWKSANPPAEELYSLCGYLVDQISRTERRRWRPIPLRGQTAKLPSHLRHAKQRYGAEARAAMEGLGEEFPELGGFYPRPKALLVSRILSVQQLCDICSPFTVEANYNREMPRYNIPHTICHELSHLKGFMREDEANFIGYMACIGSDDLQFRYSGYLTGWVYAGNALAKIDMDAYIELHKSCPRRS